MPRDRRILRLIKNPTSTTSLGNNMQPFAHIMHKIPNQNNSNEKNKNFVHHQYILKQILDKPEIIVNGKISKRVIGETI